MQIAVTGASGFIGAEIVRVLLERGHTVHGTVRDLDNDQKTDPLETLGGAQDGSDSSRRIFSMRTASMTRSMDATSSCTLRARM
ncbi:MAG: NAD-dependent epimerase/dehydratase family protein [Acidimicrobiia bacterium]